MDKYKLIVKYAAQNQWVNILSCSVHPEEQFLHKLWNKLCRRSHEDALIAVENTFFARTKITGLLYKVLSHNPVELFQMPNIIGINFRKPFICGIGVLYFLDFFCFTQYSSPVDYISDLS